MSSITLLEPDLGLAPVVDVVARSVDELPLGVVIDHEDISRQILQIRSVIDGAGVESDPDLQRLHRMDGHGHEVIDDADSKAPA